MRNAELLEMKDELLKQQKEWLHKAMQRLVPEKARRMIEAGDMPMERLVKFIHQNGFQMVPHRGNPFKMELHMKGKKVDEFNFVLWIPDKNRNNEPRPVDFFKYFRQEVYGDDIWKDGS
jgi:hypothetical protein